MHVLLAGGLAGLIATVPMSAVMKAAQLALPRWQQYALPPEQITNELAERTGVARHLDRSEKKGVSLFNHFVYGTGMGIAYGGFSLLVAPSALTGVAFGLGVWGASYLGWLPALNMRAAANHEPLGRNVMMVVSHAVWGLALGVFTAWAISR